MVGDEESELDVGLMPRLALELMKPADVGIDGEFQWSLDCTCVEVYNEQVWDVLCDERSKPLRVRESRKRGAFAEGAKVHQLAAEEDVLEILRHARKRRVASTNINARSSRSHLLVTLNLRRYEMRQQSGDSAPTVSAERVSSLKLVDLAGSERVSFTGATGTRLREASYINRSLAALSDVLRTLAESSGNTRFVPYRNSVLTRLLRESFENALITMVACVSSCADHYEETSGTLKYAESARAIRSVAKTNVSMKKDPLVLSLLSEVSVLRAELNESRRSTQSVVSPVDDILVDRLLFLEDQLQKKTEELDRLRAQQREQDESATSSDVPSPARSSARGNIEQMPPTYCLRLPGDDVNVNAPRLTNLNPDPLFSECLVYYLAKDSGAVTIGSSGDSDVHISGLEDRHCVITATCDDEEGQQSFTLLPLPYAPVAVNGIYVHLPPSRTEGRGSGAPPAPVRLFDCDRVVFGEHNIFRFDHPASPRDSVNDPLYVPDDVQVDWNFAQVELKLHQDELEAASLGASNLSYERSGHSELVHHDSPAAPFDDFSNTFLPKNGVDQVVNADTSITDGGPALGSADGKTVRFADDAGLGPENGKSLAFSDGPMLGKWQSMKSRGESHRKVVASVDPAEPNFVSAEYEGSAFLETSAQPPDWDPTTHEDATSCVPDEALEANSFADCTVEDNDTEGKNTSADTVSIRGDSLKDAERPRGSLSGAQDCTGEQSDLVSSEAQRLMADLLEMRNRLEQLQSEFCGKPCSPAEE